MSDNETPDDPATENVDDNEEEADEQLIEPPAVHVPVLHTPGTLPTATGDIAKAFHTIPTQKQQQIAAAMHTFINDGTDWLRLNVGPTMMTALVAVPDTSTVKLVYGLGYGTASIGETNNIQGKFLVLSGEGNKECGPPDVMVFDNSITTPENILNPTDTQITEALTTKGANFGKHLISPRVIAANSTDDLPQIVPIPAYLVYDGFNADLNAALVYERLIRECTMDDEWLTHAKSFLRSVLVGGYRASDNKPYTTLDKWTAMVPMEAKRWKNHQANTLFPAIFTPTQGQQPPQNHTTPPLQHTTQTAILETMLLELQRQRTAKHTSSQHEEKKDEATDDLQKVSILEKTYLKRMCGIPEQSGDECLPSWYQDLFRKYQDDKDKELIIAETLNTNNRFDDADIPIYPELRKMIMKRNWTGGEAGGVPKFPYACYGLTPFAMLDLTEDQVAEMEFDQQFLGESSNITPADIKRSKTKLTATIPESSEQWKQILLRFTNLLLALFKVECPLYQKMVEIVKAIRSYTTQTLDSLPRHSKASILWIIHLQTRHFAQGKMDVNSPTTMCLPAFSMMFNQISASAIHTVSIAGLPAKLDQPAKGNTKGLPTLPGQPPEKRTKPNVPTPPKTEGPWNTLLKSKLEQPMRIAGNPSLKEIARYCNLLREDTVIKNTKPGECRNYMIFGSCTYGKKCRLTHATASDDQATHIIETFEKFITKPNELKGKT